MKMFLKFFDTTLIVFFLALSIIVTGCNNPAGGDEEEHPHAEGAVLKTDDGEDEEIIVQIEEGQVQFGEINVTSGEQTLHINIYFLDEDGNEFQPDEPDFELRWDQIDTSVAEIVQADSDGTWGFHVVGIEQGQTQVRFKMWHLGEEHAEYVTPNIPINVN